MTAVQCLCGFTELEDEQISDHLQQVFAPPDMIGNDGQAHEEGESLSCFCGLTASTPEELDAHFLLLFTPADSISSDGEVHLRAVGAVG